MALSRLWTHLPYFWMDGFISLLFNLRPKLMQLFSLKNDNAWSQGAASLQLATFELWSPSCDVACCGGSWLIYSWKTKRYFSWNWWWAQLLWVGSVSSLLCIKKDKIWRRQMSSEQRRVQLVWAPVLCVLVLVYLKRSWARVLNYSLTKETKTNRWRDLVPITQQAERVVKVMEERIFYLGDRKIGANRLL